MQVVIQGPDHAFSSITYTVASFATCPECEISVHRHSDVVSVNHGASGTGLSLGAHLPYDAARALAELLIAACDAHDDAAQLPTNAKVVTP